MATVTFNITATPAKAAIVCIIGVLCVCAYFTAKWGFANTAGTRTADRGIAEYSSSLSPSDPGPHSTFARVLESSFDPADIDLSLKEFEAAVAASPHDYSKWLALGRARERAGDSDGAMTAFEQALKLAPNYSRVHWSVGNALIRRGDVDAGFAEIRSAFAGDDGYIVPAVVLAAQLFQDNVETVSSSLGDHPKALGEAVRLFAGQKRFTEAEAMWAKLPASVRQSELKEIGADLSRKLFDALQFAKSAAVFNECCSGGAAAGSGAVLNGGFEENIPLQNPYPFSWRIGDGAYPQIGVTSAQKKEGTKSLLMLFSSPRDTGFRTVSQTVPIEGGKYTLNFSYLSELKTTATFRFAVTDASSGMRLAATEPLTVGGNWADASAHFTVPPSSQAVTISLERENCSPPVCSVSGNIWFDSFRIEKADK